jgi:hypothetical protein
VSVGRRGRGARYRGAGGIPPPAGTGTTYLPFDLSTAPSTKIVTAHVTPWFPISLDNAPHNDTYDNSFIAPSGSYAQYGGQMRDRPYLPPGRPFAGDWALTDARSDVAQAKSIGIDAFYIDAVGMAHKPTIDKLYAAAQMDGFKCLLGGDMSGGDYTTFTATQFANDFQPYVSHAAAFKLPDGRPLIGCFMAENRNAQFWSDVKTILASRGINVALSLTCLGVGGLAALIPLCWGIGIWGNRIPPWSTVASYQPYADQAHAGGAKWMSPVAAQDVRPYSIGNPFWWEAVNHQTLRNSWDAAATHGDIVQLITWNDFREGTQFCWSQDCGHSRLDRFAWDIHRFKYGAYPTILRDTAVCTHRKQFTTSVQTFTGETAAFPQRDAGSQPATNRVEVEVWATAACTLTTTIGANVYTQAISGYGFWAYNYPLDVGGVSVKLTRGGATIYQSTSPHTVTNTPYVLDYEYKVFGGLR